MARKKTFASLTLPFLTRLRGCLVLFILCFAWGVALLAGTILPNPLITRDPTGILSTYSTAAGVDLTNPFFQSLGSNGRSCASCHQAADAWSVIPRHIQERFERSDGTDPIFRPVDGANCPSADVSSYRARKSAYGLLLNKGLIRISLPVPSGADFNITQIQDPYDCPQTTATQPAMYRRPLPATNLNFLSAVMWDGRETSPGPIPGKSINLIQSLTNQGRDATLGHAQAVHPPTPQQLAQIVAFETALYTAQAHDEEAGNLTTKGATGGPVNLSAQAFYIGINDALGGDPAGASFEPNAFSLYNS